MPLSASMLMQLTVILLLATILFFAAYRLPQIISSSALLLIIPIQPIDTRYGSANVVLTFVIFLALLLRRENVKLPLLGQFLFMLFCYLVSMSFVHRALYGQHAVYILALISAFMVFWIAYDLTFRYRHFRKIMGVLVATNILVLVYCAIQFWAGPGVQFVFFGIDEMSMLVARDDNRLTGPFSASGVTSEYLAILVLLLVHELFYTQRMSRQYGIIALICLDLGFLIATGNRGGFLSFVGGSVLFLWMFRKELGPGRVLGLMTAGAVLLGLVGTVLITYSDFNTMFARLGETSIEGGIPDTRQVTWPLAIETIKERPLLGHGPRYWMDGAGDGMKYPGWEFKQYPHNLYLFLLATVGIVGFVAFFIAFLTPLVTCWKTAFSSLASSYEKTFAKTGVVVMVVILVDQIKVEFMRISLVDYWHFVFALLGILVAACHQAKSRSKMINQQSRLAH